ncbi:isochorismatase family protein [Rhodococcus koreensis]
MKGFDVHTRPALVISECQNEITNPAFGSEPLVQQAVERDIITGINTLAAAFRGHGLPVVHCTVSARPGFEGFPINCALAAKLKKTNLLITGSVHAAIHDDLIVADTDIISERHHGMSPFSGTDLEMTLRGLGVDTVVLVGVSTNIALPGAATEAVARGFTVVLAEDCTAGGTAETHRMQVTMHLPLLATVTKSAAVRGELDAGTYRPTASVTGVAAAPGPGSSPAPDAGMTAEIDLGKCSGHARCFAASPDLFDLDDSGYALRAEVRIPPGSEDIAQAAAAACPERAIALR